MMRIGELILNQSKKILEQKQYAVLCATALSLMPFASWLSVALVALVTLRKGAKQGFEVLLPAAIIHSVPLTMLVPIESALINTAIAYLPCFFAALTLRKTVNWQYVASVFFLQALCVFVLIQLVLPGFAVEQITQFKKLLAQYPEYEQILEDSMQDISSGNLAQLFLGMQIFGVGVSALMSLLFARLIQSRLFVPGGLKTELEQFRGGRVSFLVLISVLVASYYEYPCAVSLLPLTLSYFLMAGINLGYFVLARKWRVQITIMLFLLIVLQPILMLFTYILFGLLDSLFNFRLYLPARTRESI